MHPLLVASRVLAIGQQPPGTNGLTTIIQWLMWSVALLCVGGVLIAAGSMAVAHNRGGDGSQAVGRLGWVLVACVLVGASTAVVGALV